LGDYFDRRPDGGALVTNTLAYIFRKYEKEKIPNKQERQGPVLQQFQDKCPLKVLYGNHEVSFQGTSKAVYGSFFDLVDRGWIRGAAYVTKKDADDKDVGIICQHAPTKGLAIHDFVLRDALYKYRLYSILKKIDAFKKLETEGGLYGCKLNNESMDTLNSELGIEAISANGGLTTEDRAFLADFFNNDKINGNSDDRVRKICNFLDSTFKDGKGNITGYRLPPIGAKLFEKIFEDVRFSNLSVAITNVEHLKNINIGPQDIVNFMNRVGLMVAKAEKDGNQPIFARGLTKTFAGASGRGEAALYFLWGAKITRERGEEDELLNLESFSFQNNAYRNAVDRNELSPTRVATPFFELKGLTPANSVLVCGHDQGEAKKRDCDDGTIQYGMDICRNGSDNELILSMGVMSLRGGETADQAKQMGIHQKVYVYGNDYSPSIKGNPSKQLGIDLITEFGEMQNADREHFNPAATLIQYPSTAAAAPADTSKKPKVEKYNVESKRKVEAKKIGQGAYATVYEGKDERTVVREYEAREREFKATQFVLKKLLGGDKRITKRVSKGLAKIKKQIFLKTDDEKIMVQEISRRMDGDLTSITRKPNVGIVLPFPIFKQLADGLSKMHSAGIVHRDIKPENILFSKTNRLGLSRYNCVDSSGEICQINEANITDFGLSVKIGSAEANASIAGSILYISPETLKTGEASCATDIWAFGLTIAETVCGRREEKSYVNKKEQFAPVQIMLDALLYAGLISEDNCSIDKIREAIKSLGEDRVKTKAKKVVEYIYNEVKRRSPAYAEIVKYCLEIDPKRRIKAEGLVEILEGRAYSMNVDDVELTFKAVSAEGTRQESIEQSKSFLAKKEKPSQVKIDSSREEQKKEIKAMEEILEENIVYLEWDEGKQEFVIKQRRELLEEDGENFKKNLTYLRFNRESGHTEIYIKGKLVDGKKDLSELKKEEGEIFDELPHLEKYIKSILGKEEWLDTNGDNERGIKRIKIADSNFSVENKPLNSFLKGSYLLKKINRIISKEQQVSAKNSIIGQVEALSMAIATKTSESEEEERFSEELSEELSEEFVKNACMFEEIRGRIQEESRGKVVSTSTSADGGGREAELFADIHSSSSVFLIGLGLYKESEVHEIPSGIITSEDVEVKSTIKINGESVVSLRKEDGREGLLIEDNETAMAKKAAQIMALDYRSNLYKIKLKIKEAKVAKAGLKEVEQQEQLIVLCKQSKSYLKLYKIANFFSCIYKLSSKEGPLNAFIEEFAKDIGVKKETTDTRATLFKKITSKLWNGEKIKTLFEDNTSENKDFRGYVSEIKEQNSKIERNLIESNTEIDDMQQDTIQQIANAAKDGYSTRIS
jgi:serine/threonine protein kinase